MKRDEPAPADPVAAELRELIREAHAAVKDLAPLLREARQAKAAAARAAQDEAVAAARAFCNAELSALQRHLDRQSERAARDINAAVHRAEKMIFERLTSARLVEQDGKIGLQFEGPLMKMPGAPGPA